MCSKILGATSADCTFGRGGLPPVYLIWQSRLTCTCVWDTGGLLQVKLNCLFCIDLYNNHHKGEKSRLGLKICFAKVAMIWSKDWDKRQWLIACVWTPTLTPGISLSFDFFCCSSDTERGYSVSLCYGVSPNGVMLLPQTSSSNRYCGPRTGWMFWWGGSPLFGLGMVTILLVKLQPACSG